MMGQRKKRFVQLTFIVVLSTLVIVLVVKSFIMDLSNIDRRSQNFNANNYRSSSPKIKTILFWNGARRSEMSLFGTGHDAFVQHGCAVSDCEIVNSPHQYPGRSLDSYDVIIINFNDEFWLSKRPIFNRQPHQRFVFLTQEPPTSIEPLNISSYKNYFNWTMTYRMDSDVRLLYGRILPKSTAPKSIKEIKSKIKDSTHRWITLKSKERKRRNKNLVAAMISHCTTDGLRETYIKILSKYIKVDVYGRCNFGGNNILSCDTDEMVSSTPKCYNMLESNYKFYLSFENSICPDYVTEKFFQIMSLRDIVPIVFGGANYAKLAPTHSYIDALKFRPKQLATYLKTLDVNDTLYSEYFWWKDDYIVEAGLHQMTRHGFCDLCQKLHQVNQSKIYTTLASSWDPTQCASPLQSV